LLISNEGKAVDKHVKANDKQHALLLLLMSTLATMHKRPAATLRLD
jgi:hypothetical protein